LGGGKLSNKNYTGDLLISAVFGIVAYVKEWYNFGVFLSRFYNLSKVKNG
jgi:hypothetical protein